MSGFNNLLDPAILFFVFGLVAGALRSNLQIPEPIVKFLSLYLLMALGLKGGFALAKTGFEPTMLITIGLATLLALGLPLLAYALLRRKLNAFDAAAVAATYGSVSAVTFIAATQFLDKLGVAYSGHMVVAMVLMESPALIMAVALANWVRTHNRNDKAGTATTAGGLLREAFTDGAHLLLLGGIVIGVLTGEAGKTVMAPFSSELFKGMLAFFLLDMGLTVSRQFGDLRRMGAYLLGLGFVMPLLGATLALALAKLAGLSQGDATLLATLAASASYIVVPAALRTAIPEANRALYGGLALGVTFPFNLLLGIALYQNVVSRLW